MDDDQGKDNCNKDDDSTEEATVQIARNRIVKYLEKMTKTDIWNCLAQYVIPTLGLLFIIVYFTIGFYIEQFPQL